MKLFRLIVAALCCLLSVPSFADLGIGQGASSTSSATSLINRTLIGVIGHSFDTYRLISKQPIVSIQVVAGGGTCTPQCATVITQTDAGALGPAQTCTQVAFTAPPAQGATSGTITVAQSNGSHTLVFTDGELRAVTISGTTSITWSGGLANAVQVNASMDACSVPGTIRIDGMGSPFDVGFAAFYCIVQQQEVTVAGGMISTYSCPTSIAVGSYTPGAGYGTGWIYDMGAGGSVGSYAAGWEAVARALSGNAFAIPPSYVFGMNGGRLCDAATANTGCSGVTGSPAGDLGCLGWAKAQVAYLKSKNKPLPQYDILQLGVNDALASSPVITLSTMESVTLPCLQYLVGQGIKPIFAPVAGGGSGALSFPNQTLKVQGYNLWAQSIAQSGLINTFIVDPRIKDPASVTGANLARDMLASSVHLDTANGEIDYARSFLAMMGNLLPAQITTPRNWGDQFGVTNNPTGFISIVSGSDYGVFTATAGSINLTSSAQAIGTVGGGSGGGGQVQALFNGSGGTVTAQIVARPDTNADGTPKNGFCALFTFPAGTYTVGSQVNVWIADLGGSFLHAGTQYNTGDALQFESEIIVSSTNLSGTPGIPHTQLQYNNGSGIDFSFDTLGGPTSGNNTADSTQPGILAADWDVTSVRFDVPSTDSSGFFRPVEILPIAGTTTGAISEYVCNSGIRKLNLNLNSAGQQLGEPF